MPYCGKVFILTVLWIKRKLFQHFSIMCISDNEHWPLSLTSMSTDLTLIGMALAVVYPRVVVILLLPQLWTGGAAKSLPAPLLSLPAKLQPALTEQTWPNMGSCHRGACLLSIKSCLNSWPESYPREEKPV